MANDCAVCYVADVNFLLPSLISAVSLRKFIRPDQAEVFVFLVGENDLVAKVNEAASRFQISVVPFDSGWAGEFDAGDFNKTHVTPTALGRFFLDRGLPDRIERIVYIDGDTLIRRDPSALIEAVVPEGKFAAAEDMVSFRYSRFTPRGRLKMAYLDGIGVHPPTQGYFNSGVFAVSRKSWRVIADDAFRFFIRNIKACEYHDQSALNATVGDRRLKLSLKWNFQTPYRFLGIEKFIEPCVYHFHSFPKPWMGECQPWPEIHAEYRAAVKPFESLNLPLKTLSEEALAGHNTLNWRKKLLLKSPLAGKVALMHLGIADYEKNAWL
ncbi:MAG: hypothetical protein HC850_12955 [Rhodomicrobium sp.]|nr:hypothetical protein [Rhodomicrobium sp.]